MMQNTIFNRYERKYILTKPQRDDMIEFLKNHLDFDPYSNNGKGYRVLNIYYDTHDYSIIRNSLAKPAYKEKLRLRSYQINPKPEDPVFLEIKKKFEGRINKRRLDMTYQNTLNYLHSNQVPNLKDYSSQQIFSEIDYFIKIHQAKPGAFISYQRVAFDSKNQDLRVTFDNQMLFRTKDISLDKDGGLPILLDASYSLMEVKSQDNFPYWLASKLSEYELYSQSFSKYGTAYRQLLIGGITDDYILY